MYREWNFWGEKICLSMLNQKCPQNWKVWYISIAKFYVVLLFYDWLKLFLFHLTSHLTISCLQAGAITYSSVLDKIGAFLSQTSFPSSFLCFDFWESPYSFHNYPWIFCLGLNEEPIKIIFWGGQHVGVWVILQLRHPHAQHLSNVSEWINQSLKVFHVFSERSQKSLPFMAISCFDFSGVTEFAYEKEERTSTLDS